MQNIGAVLKTLFFTIVVPGTVVGLVPWRLRRGSGIAVQGVPMWLAVILIVAGSAIYLHTAFWGFAVLGGGTPAPVAPTKRLVARGLHRYVRNPMYIGVALIIAGQAWLFRSLPTTIYLVCVLLATHCFVLLYEEPTLQKQFGKEYQAYRASVPRWIPRIRKQG
jgi:protein-S-isoprenylcysteine O-methyltransferase Ste14